MSQSSILVKIILYLMDLNTYMKPLFSIKGGLAQLVRALP